jgi:hypothetical protein
MSLCVPSRGLSRLSGALPRGWVLKPEFRADVHNVRLETPCLCSVGISRAPFTSPLGGWSSTVWSGGW